MGREERTIEVTLISATDLKTFEREQKNYVSAYVYPARRQITGVDPYGGVNPIWNSTLKLTCYESDLFPAATSSGSAPSAHEMKLEIYSYGGGIFHTADKLVGTVTVPLQQVASAVQVGGPMPTFDVRLPTESGEVRGSLNLSVKLGAKRELGEYEDLRAAPLSSYDQGAPSVIYLPAGSPLPSTQPRSSKSQGQSSVYHNYPPTTDYKSSAPNQNTFAAAGKEEDVVTGYPAPPGYYSFAPLGQLPMERQEHHHREYEPSAHGPYGVLSSPEEGTHHQTRRARKKERREMKRERKSERREHKRERKQERREHKREKRKERRAAKGKYGPALRIGFMLLHVVAAGMISSH